MKTKGAEMPPQKKTRKENKMENTKEKLNERKRHILYIAGIAQNTYWTTNLQQKNNFPKYNMKIEDIKTKEDKEIFFKRMEEMENDVEYKALSKIMKVADDIFHEMKEAYEDLNHEMKMTGIRKRNLPEFYGAMLDEMDDVLAGEMLTAKADILYPKQEEEK